MTQDYDEATLDLLRLTIPTYGIIVPIIQRSGTNEIIDGRHRMKVCEELRQEGLEIMLPVRHFDTDNPAEIDQIVNSVRRPWQDTEHRRQLVKQLKEKGHSNQRIADAVGTSKFTVARDLSGTPTIANATVGDLETKLVTGKDGRTTRPPATPGEILKAWEMKDAGASIKAIAFDLKRGEETVRRWLKGSRPEAIQTGQQLSVAAPEPEPPVPDPEPQHDPEPPKLALTPPSVKPLPVSPQERKRHYSQIKWVKERWIPAAKALMEARQLLKDENTRLGDAYRHRENGGKLFTIPFQRLANEWEDKGHLAEIAEVLGIDDQSLAAVLLKLEEMAKELESLAKSCATLASGMRMFTSCRPDNNLHLPTP
jgi:hypothetical protein